MINSLGKRKLLLLWISAYLLLTSTSLKGEEKPLLDAIKLNPIFKAPSISPSPTQAPQTVDPRAIEIAKRLRERLTVLRQGSSTKQPSSSKLRDEVEEMRNRLRAGGVKARLRRSSGTPQQIKGRMLERAVHGFGSEEERDEKTARAFLRSYRILLRLKDPDRELMLRRRHRDRLGRRHLRFSQTYRGLPVWPAELIVHLDPDGNVDLMSGTYVPTPKKLVTTAVLDSSDAIKHARAHVPGGQGAIVAAPSLIVYAPGHRPPRLAWKVKLNLSLVSNWLVVIDALNGVMLTAYNEVMNGNVVGSGEDVFGQRQTLNVWEQDGTFLMIDTSKPMFDPILNPLDSATPGTIRVEDAQNQPSELDCNLSTALPIPPLIRVSSTSATSGWLDDAVSAAFNMSETYDYFFDRHNHNSVDGEGGTIRAIVRICLGYNNAFFNQELGLMAFGDGQPFPGALDVVAHELTHGVTFHSSRLIYQGQSGALNEAFSDIFGEMVEARTLGSPDWIVGSQLGITLRNIASPSSVECLPGIACPSKMSDFFSLPITVDNGGVHINSNIVSHAFYLLAQGLPGAIGIGDAEQIFFRALTLHLTPNSDFSDARLACIQSAEELFGSDSIQAQKTSEAFDAVEIFDAPPAPQPPSFEPVSGPDATLFVFLDPFFGHFLGRREEALGDGAQGVQLSLFDVEPTRPSLTGDGTLAVFIDSINDACFIPTDGADLETCLGFAGTFSSVAMSPDGQRFGFVLRDPTTGDPENRIHINDLETGEIDPILLVAPALDGDGVSTTTVKFADAMDFTADGSFLIYDAFNVVEFEEGDRLGLWSIYAVHLATKTIFVVVQPRRGFDFGFPALSQASDNFIAFDAFSHETGQSLVLAGNLSAGDVRLVAVVEGSYGVPGYTGDDEAIVYSQRDLFAFTGFSLLRQRVQEDHITPDGSPEFWLEDADFGVIYRRGSFTGPRTFALTVRKEGTGTGLVTSRPSGIVCGADCGEGYLKETAVNLIASRADGSIFAGWSGDPDCGDGAVTVDSDKICIATFNLEPPPNQPPVANAGADKAVDPGTLVILDGRGSTDPDGDSLSFQWTENAANPTTGQLANATSDSPSFTPKVPGTYAFTLTVNDGRGGISSDAVTATVRSGAEVVCSTASEVAAIFSNPGTPEKALRILQKALTRLTDACVFLVIPDSLAAFNKIKVAVSLLDRAGKKGALTDSVVQRLANIVQVTADTKISEAISEVCESEKNVGKAQKFFDKGLEATNASQSISRFRSAFKRAERGISKQVDLTGSWMGTLKVKELGRSLKVGIFADLVQADTDLTGNFNGFGLGGSIEGTICGTAVEEFSLNFGVGSATGTGKANKDGTKMTVKLTGTEFGVPFTATGILRKQ